jgi:ankyrin repeat protein
METAALLMERGAMSDIFLEAAVGKRDQVAKRLEADAGLARTNWAGSTPLHLAAAGNHKDVCELLISHGAVANAKDAADETPADRAAEAGFDELAAFLRQQ